MSYKLLKENVLFKTKNPHVYQITNNVNNKIYVGVHNGKYTNFYSGSSSYLYDDYNVFGIENFTKTLIKEFDNMQDAYDLERQIVDLEFVKREDTYNRAVGGEGFLSGEDNPSKSPEVREKMSKWHRGKVLTEQHKANISLASKGEKNGFYGKQHSDEFRIAQSKRMTGANNPLKKSENRKKASERVKNQKWINKEGKDKYVPKEDLDKWINDGWAIGRTYKPRKKRKSKD